MSNREIILSGQRIALARMTSEDQPMFCEWLQSDELRSLIDDHRIPTLKDQMQWFTRIQQPDRQFFSLLTLPDHCLIGNAGFVDIDSEKQEATLRITIGDPDQRGKGFGTEAVQLLVRYASEVFGWRRVNLKVVQTNVRAIRSYEKAGFILDGEHLQNGKTICTMTLDLSTL